MRATNISSLACVGLLTLATWSTLRASPLTSSRAEPAAQAGSSMQLAQIQAPGGGQGGAPSGEGTGRGAGQPSAAPSGGGGQRRGGGAVSTPRQGGGGAVSAPRDGGGAGSGPRVGGERPAIRGGGERFDRGSDVRVRQGWRGDRGRVYDGRRGDRTRYRHGWRGRGYETGIYVDAGRSCHRHHRGYRVMRHCHPYGYRWHRHGPWR